MFDQREGRERAERRWATAIVLWRMPPDSAIYRHISRAQLDSVALRYRTLRRAAEDSGWKFMGGQAGSVIQDLLWDDKSNRLRVRDRLFDVPTRDSTLVVLVDLTRDAAHTPTVVGYGYVPADLPEAYWPKYWSSGDTTFHVRPRNTADMLSRLLRTNPQIAAFLDKR